MAEQRNIIFLDDLDDTEFTPGEDGETRVIIARRIAGRTLYRAVDLSADNAAAYDEAIKPFWEAGTRVLSQELVHVPKTARPAPVPSRAVVPAPAAEPTAAEIRDWAKDNGHTVTGRGRIPQTIRNAFDQAHA